MADFHVHITAMAPVTYGVFVDWFNWLARLQALSGPYCQSTCLHCVGNFDAEYLGN